MGPLAQADGHDDPEFVDESVPGLAAGLDDGVVGGEDTIGKIVLAQDHRRLRR